MRRITNTVWTVGMISSAIQFVQACGSSKVGGPVADGAAGSKTDVGTSSDAGCGTFVACGGSVVGTWKLSPTESCTPSASTLANCPGYSQSGDYQTTQTVTFSSGGTTKTVLTMTGAEVVRYPVSCASGTSCPTVGTQTDGGASATCGENPPGECYCNYVYNNFTNTSQGTYTTSGSTISTVETGSSSTPDTADYCVQGNTLKLHFIDPSAGPVTLAFTRQ